MPHVDHPKPERLEHSPSQAEQAPGTRWPALAPPTELPPGWAPPSGWDLPSEWALPLFAFGMDPRGDIGDEHV